MVKSHTFNGIKYDVVFASRIDGVSDNRRGGDSYTMIILDTGDFKAFHSALHEALESSGFCDECLHDKVGDPTTWDAARFLWRLGYRLK